jgi:cytochrome c oxidase cbb3-type subunit 1
MERPQNQVLKALTQVMARCNDPPLSPYLRPIFTPNKTPKPWNLRMSTAISPTAYNYKVVRQFAIMTVVWGILGMGLGVFIASQLVWPELNFGLPWTTFGRLRPLHTNLVIFAFGGCALFATSYYVVQRTCQTRLISDSLAAFTFWGWQAVIVGAIVTLPMGFTTTKEYAELEWPLAILLAIVWVTYGLVFFGTIVKRKTKHIYDSNPNA